MAIFNLNQWWLADRQLVYIIIKLMADGNKVYNFVVGWLNSTIILPIENNGSYKKSLEESVLGFFIGPIVVPIVYVNYIITDLLLTHISVQTTNHLCTL